MQLWFLNQPLWWHLLISSARRSILSILPAQGKISVPSILSNTNPSSTSTVEIPAALKHILVIVSIPESSLYCWTPSRDKSEP
ncbi:hypothetical protein Hanom_Chr05g00423481 [Helianthus anomalus]